MNKKFFFVLIGVILLVGGVAVFGLNSSLNTEGFELVKVSEIYGRVSQGENFVMMDSVGNEIDILEIKKESYFGKIYDLTVPNHILLVLRNGLEVWSGNSNFDLTVPSSGDLNVTFYAVDDSANIQSESVAFSVDADSPTIDFATPYNNSYYNEQGAFVNASVSDANDAFGFVADGLVSWWRMDDGSWVTDAVGGVVDYMGRNNGTAKGNASQTDAGRFGKAGSFDGVGDHLQLSNQILIGTNDFTISGWINPAYLSYGNNYSGIFLGGAASTTSAGFNMFLLRNNNRMYCYLSNGTNRVSLNPPATFPDLTWSFFTFVLNRDGNMSLYKDGVNVGNLSITSFSGNDIGGLPTQYIGRFDTNNMFSGLMDEVMIFNRSLSDDEIKALYNSTANRILYNKTDLAEGENEITVYSSDDLGNVARDSIFVNYDGTMPFVEVLSPLNTTYGNNSVLVSLNSSDDNHHYSFAEINSSPSLVGWWRAESNTQDSSGNGNDGTLVGDANANAGGVFGNAFEFDGAGDYIDYGNPSSLNISGNFSFSTWIKTSADDLTMDYILTKSTGSSFAVFQSSNYFYFTLYNSSAGTCSAYKFVKFGTNQWKHFVGVWNGTDITNYINGVVYDTSSCPGFVMATTTTSFRVGTSWNGSIDEVMIFNRSLSVDEIKALYNSSAYKYNRTVELSDGNHLVTGYAIDSAGNLNSSEVVFSTEYDSHEVSICRELWEDDAIYTLQNDVATDTNCFEITGNNVTLDFNGFNITGDDGVGSEGVYVSGENVTLIDALIYDFGYGIYFNSVNGANISHANISSSSTKDIYATSSSANLNLTNSTYVSELVDAGSSLQRWMYLTGNVTRSSGGAVLENANVSLRDEDSVEISSLLSGADGGVDFGLIKRYTNDGGNLFYNAYDTRTTKSPYTTKVVAITNNDTQDLNIAMQYGTYSIESSQTIQEVYTNIGDDGAFANLSDSERCRFVSNINLNVTYGGLFNITNCTLEMNSNGAEYKTLSVSNGGHLYIDYSNITRGYDTNYRFYTLDGSNLTIKNSYVSRVGSDSSEELFKGLTINSSNAVLSNNTFFTGLANLIVYSNNNFIYDTVFYDGNTAIGDNIRLEGDNLTLVRCNLSDPSPGRADISLDANKRLIVLDTNYTEVHFDTDEGLEATLTRQWSYNVCTSPALADVVISAYNISGGNQTFFDAGTTDETGCYEFNLTSYIQNSSGTRNYYNNYTFALTKTGYDNGAAALTNHSTIGSKIVTMSVTVIPSSSPTSSGGGGGGGGNVAPAYEVVVEGIKIDVTNLNIDFVVDSDKERIVRVSNEGDSPLKINLGSEGLDGIVSFDQNNFELGAGEYKDISIVFVAPNESGVYTGKVFIAGKEILVSLNVRSVPLLFDAMIVVPDSDKKIKVGDKLDTQVTLIPMGEDPRLDVTLNYAIRDFSGKIYLTESETILVDSQKSFRKQFYTGNLGVGSYVVSLELVYPNGVATSSSHFEIVNELPVNYKFILVGLMLGIVLVSILIGIIMIKYKKKRKCRFSRKQR